MEYFIDSNVFLNLLLNEEHAEEAEKILSNVELGIDVGYVTPSILEEVTFKLIIIEGTKLQSKANIWALREKLREDENFRKKILKLVNKFSDYIENLLRGGLRIIPLLSDDFLYSLTIIERYGLLPSDAMIIAAMKRKNVKTIATFDRDFKVIKGIKIIP